MLYTVIFIILILALFGAFGTGGYGFGHYATGGLGFLLVLVLAMLLIG